MPSSTAQSSTNRLQQPQSVDSVLLPQQNHSRIFTSLLLRALFIVSGTGLMYTQRQVVFLGLISGKEKRANKEISIYQA